MPMLPAALERRWAGYDQPILLLAYYLDVRRHDQWCFDPTNPFTARGNLSALAVEAYKRMVASEDQQALAQLVASMEDYARGRGPFVQGATCLSTQQLACPP